MQNNQKETQNEPTTDNVLHLFESCCLTHYAGGVGAFYMAHCLIIGPCLPIILYSESQRSNSSVDALKCTLGKVITVTNVLVASLIVMET